MISTEESAARRSRPLTDAGHSSMRFCRQRHDAIGRSRQAEKGTEPEDVAVAGSTSPRPATVS